MPSLQNYSTFGLEASCTSIHPFTDVSSFLPLYNADESTYILGGGSNSLFIEDFQGTVLVNEIKGISHYDTADHHYLRVGAGENWHDLVTLCTENKWYGMENLALIPGSVGACPIQNIGAYGCEVKSFVDTVEIVLLESGEQVLLTNVDCQFGYRDSVFKHALADKMLITHVNFKLPKSYKLETRYGELSQLAEPTPEKIYYKVMAVRKSKLPDPAQLGNAGSFFKNPVIAKAHYAKLKQAFPDMPSYPVSETEIKVPAAWLIDKQGFKGKVLNAVRCHPTQPLVLTNTGGAQGKDVVALARAIIQAVADAFAITLEPEVRLVGKKGLITL